MKILFICHGFPPLHGSGTIRSEKMARYLPDYGVSPVVFCSSDMGRNPHLSVDENWIDDPRWPAVSRTPWKIRELTENIGFVKKLLRRIPVMSWIISNQARKTVAELLLPLAEELIETEKPDAVYVSVPPEHALFLAVLLKKKYNLPTVADLRDVWSHLPDRLYYHRLDFLCELKSTRTLLDRCEKVIVNTQAAREVLSDVGIDSSKLEFIPNGYDECDYADIAPRREPDDVFRIVHAGALSAGVTDRKTVFQKVKNRLGFYYHPLENDYSTRSPEYFLRALARLLARRPELINRVEVQFLGADTPAMKDLCRAFPYPSCISVTPRLPAAEALGICAKADLLLLLQYQNYYKGRPLCIAVPGKLYDYLRLGRRILAPVQAGEITDIINKYRAGVTVPPVDVAAIEQALEKEIDGKMTAPGDDRDLSLYERRRQAEQLADVMKSLHRQKRADQ